LLLGTRPAGREYSWLYLSAKPVTTVTVVTGHSDRFSWGDESVSWLLLPSAGFGRHVRQS
jgi:hypothetical protein